MWLSHGLSQLPREPHQHAGADASERSIRDALPPATAKRSHKLVKDALVKLGLKLGRLLDIGDLEGIIVNDGGATAHYMKDICMTITAARGSTGGYWLSYEGWRTSLRELSALQGFEPGTYTIPPGVTHRQADHMIGSAFTKTVIERLFYRSLLRQASCAQARRRYGMGLAECGQT
eukprot:NODE_10688_length_1335_cov_3.846854.p1 GENE.NODE_10688_length_1335_cov_3.846854~~NODE_10688_length_1335_cov_3.846854.p1  ORF type:complete len:176 (-),score=12.76 NODE_10688_length_1335_cov_3.846854:179-706(-)